jgi:hypothetical protein
MRKETRYGRYTVAETEREREREGEIGSGMVSI